MRPDFTLDLDLSDVVTFPHCAVENGEVHDRLTGRLVPVNAVGRHIVGVCDGTRRLRDVVGSIVDFFDVDTAQAAADLLAFVDGAERLGLIRVRRSAYARLLPHAVGARILDLAALRAPRTERRRYAPTALGAAAATLRAARLPLALCALVVPLLALVLAGQPHVRLPELIGAAVAPFAGMLFVLTTIWSHEWGHLLALPPAMRAGGYVQAVPMQVTVVGPGRPGPGAGLVAVAGPGLAVLICLVAAVTLHIGHVSPRGVVVLPLLVAVAHLASLAPWANDGRTLMVARRAAHVREGHGNG